MIPLLEDPPLVSSSYSHAGQYLLQMKAMAEFSKQSVGLAQNGAVQITENTWNELAEQCCLPKEVLRKVLDRWTQDGDDGAKFLERVDGDFYTLGQSHQKALEFLKRQGEIRIEQSNRGKASASKRAMAKRDITRKKLEHREKS